MIVEEWEEGLMCNRWWRTLSFLKKGVVMLPRRQLYFIVSYSSIHVLQYSTHTRIHARTRTYTSVIALGTLAQPPSNCTITTHLARRARNQKTVHQALRVALYCALGLRLALSLSAPWKKPLPSMLAIHGAAICCCCLTLGKYLL